MNIKIQKILRFIPLINFITVFLWLRTLYRHNATRTHFFKKMFLMFGGIILILIPEIIIDTVFDETVLHTVIELITRYLLLFYISYIAVKDQENIEKSQNVN